MHPNRRWTTAWMQEVGRRRMPKPRLAQVFPIRRVRHEFPLRAAYFRQVLPPVHGFPMRRVLCLIRHPIRMRPASMTACLTLSLSDLSTRAQSGFQDLLPYVSLTLTASKPNPGQELLGLPGFSSVSLPACHGLWTPADLRVLAKSDASVLPSVYVKTLGVRNMLISKLYQHFRAHGRPYGLQDSLSTLRPACSPLPRLRHGRKTRYGWVANPCPTGTCTPQDTPGFARRDNDRTHRRQTA
jgi:hypothetical protein